MGTEKEQIDPEIADARERAAKARAKIAAKRESAAPDIEKRKELDEAALLEAQAEHGEDAVGAAESRLGLVVVRKPSAREYAAFHDRVAKLKKSESMHDATKALVVSCLVHPSRDQFVEILADQPGTLDRIGTLVLELGGAIKGE